MLVALVSAVMLAAGWTIAEAARAPGQANLTVTFMGHHVILFNASGPLYSRLFDGSEVLTGITSTPWYNREITVP